MKFLVAILMPLVVQIMGVTLGHLRRPRSTGLFWVSIAGLLLYAGGYLFGLYANYLERSQYNEPLAMGPISTIAFFTFVAGAALALVSFGMQVSIAIRRLRRTNRTNG